MFTSSTAQVKDTTYRGTRSQHVPLNNIGKIKTHIPTTFITESLINSSSANNSNSDVA